MTDPIPEVAAQVTGWYTKAVTFVKSNWHVVSITVLGTLVLEHLGPVLLKLL